MRKPRSKADKEASETASEARWQKVFAASEKQLAALAEEALKEFRAGKTEPLDPDRLGLPRSKRQPRKSRRDLDRGDRRSV